MINPFNRLLPQVAKALNDCPNNCQPSWVFFAVPRDPLTMPYPCRCMKCLSYWEVTAGGGVINIQHPFERPAKEVQN